MNVIGTSGSGKTTTGADLARRLGVPYVELDALYWGPNWQPVPAPDFRERVAAAVAEDAWVIDGKYGASSARDLVWPRADTVVWLDLPRVVVMWRVVARTVRRMVRREVLWSGNRESLRMALGRDSIIVWAWTTFDRRRRDYPRVLAVNPHLAVVRLRSSGEVRRFLDSVSSPAEAPTAPRT